jgi:predicted anti-sigma-YlaC factor YlaD
MDCTEFHQLLDAYLDEKLDESRRSEFRSHLRECASCREWARSEEPTLLFVVDESDPVDMTRIEACAVTVTGQIRQQRLSRRLRSNRRPWLAAAAAAVLVVVGAAAWQLVPFGDEAPVVSLDSGPPAVDTDAAPPTVEVEMPGDDVRVYQFANDDDDTAVYFIVNPALEL